MGIIFSVGAFVLAMLILLMLQLSPSLFMVSYHYNCGRMSQKSANRFGVYYIFGTMLATSFLLVATFFLTCDSDLMRWILAGIVFAVGIVFGLFYFRKGRGTRLFLAQKISDSLTKNAQNIKKPSDALMLGAMAKIPELIFSLPLYIVLALCIGSFDDAVLRTSLGIIVIVSSILPMLVILGFFKSGRNLADIQRMRVKNKQFIRLFVVGCYLIIASLLIASEILQ